MAWNYLLRSDGGRLDSLSMWNWDGMGIERTEDQIAERRRTVGGSVGLVVPAKRKWRAAEATLQVYLPRTLATVIMGAMNFAAKNIPKRNAGTTARAAILSIM